MQHQAKTGQSSNRLSRWGIAAVVLVSMGTSMQAQARVSTQNYTCSDVKDLIFRQGAIVLNIKGNSVYKRFVADRSFCQANQRLERINVPSKSEKCRLHFCVERVEND